MLNLRPNRFYGTSYKNAASSSNTAEAHLKHGLNLDWARYENAIALALSTCCVPPSGYCMCNIANIKSRLLFWTNFLFFFLIWSFQAQYQRRHLLKTGKCSLRKMHRQEMLKPKVSGGHIVIKRVWLLGNSPMKVF